LKNKTTKILRSAALVAVSPVMLPVALVLVLLTLPGLWLYELRAASVWMDIFFKPIKKIFPWEGSIAECEAGKENE
jgi:hypothetical protein